MAEGPPLQEWLQSAFMPPRRVLYKRLSGNDTGATGSHQVGPYIPNRIAFVLAPELDGDEPNPRRRMTCRLVSHQQSSTPTLIHYNSRLRGAGTRDECRLTGFGGRASAFQDPENTGGLLVLSVDQDGRSIEAWLGKTAAETDLMEAHLGLVEPGLVGFLGQDSTGTFAAFEERGRADLCSPGIDDLPSEWKARFPTPAELSTESALRAGTRGLTADARLLRRHECEYGLFRVVEEHHLLPSIGASFTSVGAFLSRAQSTLQRRKSRAGKALELQLARIFDEEGISYSAQGTSEGGHRPDFLFPSEASYRAATLGDPTIAMLAAKSTLRDRWRQVLREADKIPIKHLFTLDEGVSEAQFRDMAASGLQLVVPAARMGSFPRGLRRSLKSLGTFVSERREAQSP